ncbi:MAG: hypothetical protein AUK44_00110 [Porphyromonadaceae bacterium CG2_30_38_12]|nr:MAG: hypothetical protein AUK44_00110 [Porphyromonadaceae bacterium CG2_30_38_12]
MQRKAFPGCQIYVLKNATPIYDKCFGYLTYDSSMPVMPTTLYDLASLTKTTGTLLAIMKLYDNGFLKLSDKASDYLRFLKGTDKEQISISELLYHESGLPAYIEFGIRNSSQTQQIADSIAMQHIAKSKRGAKTYLYSCLNFILLKEIVEHISGLTLNAYLFKNFYLPMNLHRIAFLPLQCFKVEEIAPTLKKIKAPNVLLQGIVHDPDAAFLGGVSGNAGLFAAAHDVAWVHQLLLNGGDMDGKRYLSYETCQIFTNCVSASGRRGLGFDRPTPQKPLSNACCSDSSPVSYGHTGYTGTCCWVDPTRKLIYVFLSNRTYPNDKENILARMSIRPKIQQVIYNMINDK